VEDGLLVQDGIEIKALWALGRLHRASSRVRPGAAHALLDGRLQRQHRH
jgi:hypothetical protein